MPDQNGVSDLLYKSLAKPLLFKMDPEQAHHLIIGGLSGVGKVRPVPSGLRVMYGVRETLTWRWTCLVATFLPLLVLQQAWTKMVRL